MALQVTGDRKAPSFSRYDGARYFALIFSWPCPDGTDKRKVSGCGKARAFIAVTIQFPGLRRLLRFARKIVPRKDVESFTLW